MLLKNVLKQLNHPYNPFSSYGLENFPAKMAYDLPLARNDNMTFSS